MAPKGTPGEAKTDALAVCLARGDCVADAAREAGICLRTARRRLKEPAFVALVSEIRRERRDRAVGLLTESAVEAVETLRCLLRPGLEAPPTEEGTFQEPNPASVRRQAAKDILELGSKLRIEIDLEERLCRLEEQSKGQAPVESKEM